MPLLISPIDGAPMRQIHRYGIEIDVCPTSGGIWLDRGELEKILSILQEDLQAAAAQARPSAAPPQYRERDDDDRREYKEYKNDGRKYDDHKYHGKHYKKDKMSRLFDIFDL